MNPAFVWTVPWFVYTILDEVNSVVNINILSQVKQHNILLNVRESDTFWHCGSC